MESAPGDITRLLREWREGDRAAENELFTLVLPQLRRIAQTLMTRERKGHTLQATELVDQICLRLLNARNRDWQNRRHLFAIAARAMRRHLIDHARRRPGVVLIELEGLENLLTVDSLDPDTVIHIDRLLEEMATVNPAWAEVVEIKFFLGLTNEETAEAVGMKLRTMQRVWRDARVWLFERMDVRHEDPAVAPAGTAPASFNSVSAGD